MNLLIFNLFNRPIFNHPIFLIFNLINLLILPSSILTCRTTLSHLLIFPFSHFLSLSHQLSFLYTSIFLCTNLTGEIPVRFCLPILTLSSPNLLILLSSNLMNLQIFQSPNLTLAFDLLRLRSATTAQSPNEVF